MNISSKAPHIKENSLKKLKIIVDLGPCLCYIMNYLSDERSIFVRFFGYKNCRKVHIQGGNARSTAG